ncbi:hypothetical protein BDY24DRAFT_397802 [Mrakia frigida]|uniref:uncharacterized protein n=1 Tax=Mrakia frigida TaxID=29902 RepID=UPI003FCC1EE9
MIETLLCLVRLSLLSDFSEGEKQLSISLFSNIQKKIFLPQLGRKEWQAIRNEEAAPCISPLSLLSDSHLPPKKQDLSLTPS